MNVYGYLRVSTDQQVESGLGLEAQQIAISDYAKKLGCEVSNIYRDEGISGSLSLEKRPGMLNAISILKKDDILVVAKRDRLGRDPLVVAMIESAIARKGARIVSAAGEGTENNDPSSILMRRMIDAFGEYERLIIKARTKSALQAKKGKGQRVGHIPYGYRLADDKIHLVPDIKEQGTLNHIKELRSNGISIRAAAAVLNEKHILNRGDAPWNHASLHRIITNTKNC
jgi:DNA invertase Pin-like site-specific DNA recombinase